MNITDYYSGSIIAEIVSIFKEIEMDIQVTRVNVEETKYGIKKVLYTTDGKKYRIGTRQKFYDSVQDPGLYSITMGDFEGKPFVKWLEYKGPLPDAPKPSAPRAVAAAVNTTPSLSASDRMYFEKKKQDDIRLEFYTGIAKDIAIANKKANEDINPLDVIHTAKKLCVAHVSCLEMIDAELKAIDIENSKMEDNKDVDVSNAEEEPPF